MNHEGKEYLDLEVSFDKRNALRMSGRVYENQNMSLVGWIVTMKTGASFKTIRSVFNQTESDLVMQSLPMLLEKYGLKMSDALSVECYVTLAHRDTLKPSDIALIKRAQNLFLSHGQRVSVHINGLVKVHNLIFANHYGLR